MCIGMPMQVKQQEAGHAWVEGRGERRRVNTALLGDCRPGDWLLVFLDGARERLSPERAAEIDATLNLLGDALAGLDASQGSAAFSLPSAMSADQLAALTGAPAAVPSTVPANTPVKETP